MKYISVSKCDMYDVKQATAHTDLPLMAMCDQNY